MNIDKEQYIYIEVCLPLPFHQTFTYKIRKEVYNKLSDKELVGRRVLVPFRNIGYTGIVLEEFHEDFSVYEDYEIKEIEDIPDSVPVFTQKEINIAKNISDYYVAPLGITLHYFLPAGLRWKKVNGKWIKKSPENYVYYLIKYDTKKLTAKQKELLEFIATNGEITEMEILETGFSKSTLQSLLKKGLVGKKSLVFYKQSERKISQDISGLFDIKLPKKPVYFGYTKAQDRIKKYIQLIHNLKKENKSVMIVFPSISQLQKSYEILSNYFDKVYAYHDGLSANENVKTWFLLKEKSPSILLTSYSGILMPIKDLALIILEEEGSDAYKTLRTPKFDTRRAVYEIYREKSIHLMFSSFVPSVETYYSLTKKIFLPLKRSIKTERKEVKIFPFDKDFSIKKLIELLKEDKKTLVLANKKAYASFLYCPRCEEEIVCETCDVPLKVYKTENGKFLKCEMCKTKYEFIDTCIYCEETKLQVVGVGIEKLEEILKRHFQDNVSYLSENKDTKIKIETTLMDKDLTVQNFERVINIFPDFFLFMQDYKGREKFFRNIVYSYLKAKDEFILFTNQKHDFAVKALLNSDLDEFYKKELEIRKKLEQPPFKTYILLTFEKKKLDISFLNEVFKGWLKENNIENIKYKGIFKAFHSVVKGKERAQVLLIDFKDKKALKNLSEKCRKLGIKLIVDINPVNFV